MNKPYHETEHGVDLISTIHWYRLSDKFPDKNNTWMHVIHKWNKSIAISAVVYNGLFWDDGGNTIDESDIILWAHEIDAEEVLKETGFYERYLPQN